MVFLLFILEEIDLFVKEVVSSREVWYIIV
jgi:hypothetical protein